MAVVQVQVIPSAFTLLGSGPLLISTPQALGITTSGSGVPLASAAFMGVQPTVDKPFSVTFSELVYGIGLIPQNPNTPTVVPSFTVTVTT